MICKIDASITETSKDFPTYLVLVSSLFCSPSVDIIAEFTGEQKEFVSSVYYKMRKAGIWRDNEIEVDDGEKENPSDLELCIEFTLWALMIENKIACAHYVQCEKCKREYLQSDFKWYEETISYSPYCNACNSKPNKYTIKLHSLEELIDKWVS